MSILRSNNIVKGDVLKKCIDYVMDITSESLINCYGPYGENTIVANDSSDGYSDRITKDGFTILNHIKMGEPIESNILRRIIDIAHAVVSDSGDGSTSAVLVANAVWNNISKLDSLNKLSSREKVKTIEMITDEVVKRLKSKVKYIDTIDKIHAIADVSLNGDEELVELIENAYNELGFDAYIDSRPSNNENSYLKANKGVEIPYKYLDPLLINTTHKTVEIGNNDSDVKVLMFDRNINGDKYQEVLRSAILKLSNPKDDSIRNLLVIAPGHSPNTASILQKIITHNRESGMLGHFNYVQMPVSKEHQEMMFNDIAAILGAEPVFVSTNEVIIEEENGKIVKNKLLDKLGSCKKVISNKSSTRFIKPSKIEGEDIKMRLKEAVITRDNLLEDDTVPHMEKFKAMKRVAFLKGNYGTIFVGGVTTQEKNQRLHLLEDALLSCKSAIQEGYLQAANVAPLCVLTELADTMTSEVEFDDTTCANACSDTLKAYKDAYNDVHRLIYDNAKMDKDEIDSIVSDEIRTGRAYDIREQNGEIICSAKTDIQIVKAVSSILKLLISTNQYLLENTLHATTYKE